MDTTPTAETTPDETTGNADPALEITEATTDSGKLRSSQGILLIGALLVMVLTHHSHIYAGSGSGTGSTGSASASASVSASASASVSGSGGGIQVPAYYWLGQTNNLWTSQNYASNVTGTPVTTTPGATDNVAFSATGASHLDTTLGADLSIKGLFVDQSALVTIAGGKTLTIGVGGIGLSFTPAVQGGGTSTLTVTGAGTVLTTTGALVLGETIDTHAVLNITNGAAVTSADGRVGTSPNSVATVTVDGAGSTWTNLNSSTDLVIGTLGTGTLNIQNGGVVNVGGGTGRVELGGVKTATLNIGAFGGSTTAGTLNAGEVYSPLAACRTIQLLL